MHDVKMQFGCGLFAGGVLGAGIGWYFVELVGWPLVITSVVAGLVLAPLCARYGDPIWYRLGSWLRGIAEL